MVTLTKDPRKLLVTVENFRNTPTSRLDAVCMLSSTERGIVIEYKHHLIFNRPNELADWTPISSYSYSLKPELQVQLYFAVRDEFWKAMCSPEDMIATPEE